MEVSPTTLEAFYSGSYQDIARAVKVLKIGDVKLTTLTKEEVNLVQERADREIDGILNDLYHTPFRRKKKMGPDGKYRDSFPGDLVQAAIYYTAGLLMESQFQSVQSNTNEQTNSVLEKAKQMVYELKRNTHWISAAERKSNISRTMPPTWQPAWTTQPQ